MEVLMNHPMFLPERNYKNKTGKKKPSKLSEKKARLREMIKRKLRIKLK